ncbi:hypothetical protein BV372_03990 [Nostoc sp. T09]|nr:hypothetical protein BV372_03990 [Nostoc sp. T09]
MRTKVFPLRKLAGAVFVKMPIDNEIDSKSHIIIILILMQLGCKSSHQNFCYLIDDDFLTESYSKKISAPDNMLRIVFNNPDFKAG